MTRHDKANGKRHGWNIIKKDWDGFDEYLTVPMMPDGERQWGDMPQRAIFRDLQRAKDECAYYGGTVVPE